MRRLIVVGLMVVSLAGCKRSAETESAATAAPKDAPIVLGTSFKVNDEHAAAYILHGFYGLEEGQWRWVSSKFGVTLAEPIDAAKDGARLELKFTYPEAAAKQLGALTLSGTVNGQPLLPETYKTQGKYTYTRDLAGSTFHGGPVTVEFATDKALPQSPPDVRELSIIVTEAGLSAR
jgi:hypothetical protein